MRADKNMSKNNKRDTYSEMLQELKVKVFLTQNKCEKIC